MRRDVIRIRSRSFWQLPQVAVAVVAACVLAFACARLETRPEGRPAGPGTIAPGEAIPPPDAPAELARPLPIPVPPAAGHDDPQPAEKGATVPKPDAETPAGSPADGVQDLPASAGRPPDPGSADGPAATAPPPAPAETASPADSSQIPPAGPADPASAGRKAAKGKNSGKPAVAAGSGGPRDAAAAEPPIWVRENEELSYKITFMGVTAGYARFLSKGKVRIGGRDAYHILVKAWTTGTLSVLFPISESFDYYLDAETLAPIRRDSWIRKVNRPEIVLFDQEKGTVTHWYADTMEVRKKKQVQPPTFYEGVSATYFFRTRGIGDRSVSIRVFGGRKMYRVSSERAGEEKIPYGSGNVETFLVKPIYKEEGGSGEKPMLGELVVWVSNDPHRVPVKLFAAFRKGLEWRLVGELTSGLPGS